MFSSFNLFLLATYLLLDIGKTTFAATDTSSLKHFGIEIRTALNYQTECIRRELSNLTSVLFSQHSSSASSFIEQASQRFGELGVLKSNIEQLVKEMNVAKDRIDYLFRDQIELRTNVKKFKKDYKHMKIENENIKQKLIGLENNYGVYFDAYRNEEYKSEGNLTYNGCNVNEGDAMNITTGIFTAPRKGIYQLTFHANTVKGKDSLILIRHNGSTLAGAFDTDNYKHNTLAQMVLVDLEVGDQVWIEILSGGVRSKKYICSFCRILTSFSIKLTAVKSNTD